MDIEFVSLFSGIESASVAWEALGWKCLAVAEIEKFPCEVLAQRYPDVPNLGDVTAPDFIEKVRVLRPQVLVGGPPCQDYSVAGPRKGLDGNRGILTLKYVEVIHELREDERFICAITENVPGWLNVSEGYAFGAYLAKLVGADTAFVPPRKCGGRWTNAGMVDGPCGRAVWRTLDAQYFGLAQRRKRVFVVFCPHHGPDPAQILFECARLRGNPAPRRETGEGITHDVAPSLTSSGRGVERGGESRGQDPVVACALRGEGFDASEDGHLIPMAFQANASPSQSMNPSEIAPTLDVGKAGAVSCFGFKAGQGAKAGGIGYAEEQSPTLTAAESGLNTAPSIMQGMAVRRLMPVECERLQGFPDGWTLVQIGKKKAADGPRYKSLGNSKAVSVMRWLGRQVERMLDV